MHRPPNGDTIIHLWEDDSFKVTVCGLVKEVVVPTWNGVKRLCDDCRVISMGLGPKPTPAEAAFLEVFFPNA